MKIFQIIDSRNFGGIEMHILQLCLFLKNKGIENSVTFVSYYEKNDLRDILIKNNIQFTEGNLFNIIKNNKNEVFHSHGYKANILNKSIKFIFKQKTVCSYHSGEKPEGIVAAYEFIDKKSAFLSNKNIAISNKIKKQIFSKNTNVVYNFVYKEPKFRHKYCIENISFIGRLSKEKNPFDFFDISKKHKKFNFNIFGTGVLQHQIPNEKNIFFYGYVQDQDVIWDKTDVLLITSKDEGLPYVLIEAMLRGLIVVSYKVGEIPNIIESGRNGFLVDSLDEMKSVLDYLDKASHKEKEAIRIESLNTFKDLFGKNKGNDYLSYYN